VPPSSSVLTARLDRLTGVIGTDTVELGIVPLTASLKVPPGPGFWIYDDRQVVTEAWHAELWLDDDDSVALYLRTWKTLRESAVYGAGVSFGPRSPGEPPTRPHGLDLARDAQARVHNACTPARELPGNRR
jgi:Domain of unknown function (DUF5753)